MRRTALLAAALLPLSAMADGAAENRSFSSSSSVSTSSHTDGSGNTVTTITTTRDGKTQTRRTVTGPDGKVISETSEGEADEKPEEPAKPGGPWLGIHTGDVPDVLREQLDLSENEGVLVEQLAPDSPAGRGGLAKNDIILRYNLTPVNSAASLRKELGKGESGEKVLIEYLRKGQRAKAAVTLGKRGESTAKAAEPPAAEAPGGKTGKTSSRTVIVGKGGKAEIVIDNEKGGDPFAEMLKDPNIPEAMKENLRKMQEQMRDFNKRNGGLLPGGKKGDAQ